MSLSSKWAVMSPRLVVPALIIGGFAATLGAGLWQSAAEPPLSSAPIKAPETAIALPPSLPPEPPAEEPGVTPATPATLAPEAPPAQERPARRETPDSPGYYLHSHRDM